MSNQFKIYLIVFVFFIQFFISDDLYSQNNNIIIKNLIDLLKSEDYQVKINAILELAKQKDKALESLPFLIELLQQEDNSDIKSTTMYALTEIAPQKESVIKAIVNTLSDKDWNVISSACDALEEIGPKAEIAIPYLIKLLEYDTYHKESNVPFAASSALAKIGVKAVPSLLLALKSDLPKVRESAISAIIQMGEKAKTTVPSLIDALSDENPGVRRYSVEALGGLEKQAAIAVPHLIKTLTEDNDVYVRAYAARVLGKIGMSADIVIPVLIKSLDDKDRVVSEVAMAIEKFRSQASYAVPYLINTFQNQYITNNTKADIISVLGEFPEQASSIVPVLIRIMKKYSYHKRILYISSISLGKMGSQARESLPLLKKFLRDKDISNKCYEYINKAIQNSIEKIEK